MALVGTRLFVALDAGAASAAAVGGGLAGPRLRGFARIPLEPGVIQPSASGTSLPRPEQARDAIRRAVAGAGAQASQATLVLPGALARLALLVLPPDADAREFVRFRLSPSLPWAAADSVVDVLPIGGRQVVAAALRRAAVAEHEQALASAGLEPERVLLAPLVAVPACLQAGPRHAVHVILGDSAACLLAVRGGEVAALRSRLRDTSAGEAERLAADAAGTAQLGETADGQVPPLVFWGTDSARLAGELGPPASAAPPPRGATPDAAQAAWLPGILA